MMGSEPHERELGEEATDDEIIRYHQTWRPHEIADIVYERLERDE